MQAQSRDWPISALFFLSYYYTLRRNASYNNYAYDEMPLIYNNYRCIKLNPRTSTPSHLHPLTFTLTPPQRCGFCAPSQPHGVSTAVARQPVCCRHCCAVRSATGLLRPKLRWTKCTSGEFFMGGRRGSIVLSSYVHIFKVPEEKVILSCKGLCG